MAKASHVRRNFALGVANGVIFMAGSALLAPTTILPQFLSNIFQSEAAIGIGANLMMMGWSLPQVFVAYYFRSRSHRKPLYIAGNVVRMALIGAFVLGAWLFTDRPNVIGALFFICLGGAGMAAGLVGLAYQDIVARTIPPTRRGIYNAFRILGGQGIMALAGSIFVKYVLNNPEQFPFPGNYIIIFGLAWALMTTGVTAFALVKEPADPTPKAREPLRRYILELYLIVRVNRNYRRFLVQKALWSCGLVASSYYVVFATRVLGLPEGVAGTFQIVVVATTLAAAIMMGMISDRQGNRQVLFLSSLASAAAPVMALLVAGLAAWGAFRGEAVTLVAGGATVGMKTALTALMAPIFVLMAISAVGGHIGFQNYIMDSAPRRRLPLYLGLATTIDGVLLIVLPALGGKVISVVNRGADAGMAGYAAAFVATAVLVTASAVGARRLAEPRAGLSYR